ncbi:unnamed protein product [Mycena citricolor]|uniref:glutathione transferase n=1 Tax=Mycena citricolor TaxID=2018698 RepID=A0AAD2JXY3_9AGAR|nr:unnamed protein product [Mycena citricolor]
MVLKLHGFSRVGGGTQSVLVTLLEKQVPFENCTIDTANNAHRSPQYMAMQPFGQYPVIDDDGFILYESRAICRYLEDMYPAQGTRLGPPSGDVRARALFEQAISVESSNFNPHAHSIFAERVINPLRGLTCDESVVEEALRKLCVTLDVYESVLGKTRYLAGEEFTLADLFHLAFGAALAQAGCGIMTSDARPNVARFVLCRRACVILTVCGDGGKISSPDRPCRGSLKGRCLPV